MTYSIKQKDLRPAGDWLITAEDENGEVFHDTFSYEPTETEVNTIATQRLALLAEKEAAEE